MAPITASSQSKSRLKTFNFEACVQDVPAEIYNSEEALSEKENIHPDENESARQMEPPPQLLSSQRSVTKDIRECPQTPIGRLPLADLLASGSDARQNFTPMERVLWDNSPIISEPESSMPARKKRKRAHSTSPASSSQNETSNHFAGGKRAGDAHTPQRALKTPEADPDPADDLWSRYSNNGNIGDRHSPSAPAGIPNSHLMHSSSPQTPLAHVPGRENGRLRRALSCIEWPTSAAKRRKLLHNSSQGEASTRLATKDRPNESTERSKMSRVNLLVEQIHHGLSNPHGRQECSSSEPIRSSPTVHKDAEVTDGAIASSPDPDQRIVEEVVAGLNQTVVTEKDPVSGPLVLSAEEISGLDKAEESSDFGDDDLDVGLDFDMLEAVSSSAQLQMQNATGTTAAQTLTRKKAAKLDTVKPKVKLASFQDHKSSDTSNFSYLASKTLRQQSPPHDEFDDDEVDASAADLEDVFAQYDTQPLPRAQPDEHPLPVEVNASSVRPTSAMMAATFRDQATEQHVTTTDAQVLSDDNDFGGDSDLEQIAAECAQASQGRHGKPPDQSSHDRKHPTIQRYIIKAVAEGDYEAEYGVKRPEKVLSVQSEQTKLSKAISLRQAWIDSPCHPGSYIHLIGEFDKYGQCVIDNSENLLILHPDHLISSTVVGDSFTCTRKAVLQDRVKTTSDANQSTIYGHILHEIFQEAMRANRWDDEFMASAIEAIASRYLESLFEVNIELSMAIDQLKARAVDFQSWAELFVGAKPKPTAIIKDRNGAQALISVNKLLEVEEHVWSPMYGLKGNVDATVQVLLKDGPDEKTLTVPFELKTGKHSSAAHKAQTSLYTLLLSDRYDVEIACGILYYMQTSEISNIRTMRHELVPMIMQRNELASYVRHRVELPPMIRRPYTCGKCYAQTPCFIYHKMIDNGNGETSGMGQKFEDLVRHLKLEHQQFFSKWDDLLTKEEKDMVKIRRELWTMESSEREKAGRCFGNLIIDPGSFHEEVEAQKINRFRYTLIKQSLPSKFAFTESQVALGEPIVISDEQGHFALANGYVTRVRKQQIQVTVDRRLHNARAKGKDFDAQRNQVFTGIMEVVEDGNSRSTVTPTQPEEPVLYRLDKDEFSNGMALIRNNLIRLMEKNVFGVQALRRLIVEGVSPSFSPVASGYSLADTASQASLNIDQRAAIEKVMSAKDYALVLGMPGTGKTTTIAHIIRALVAQGKSVLLTSYTHTAVDNILLKLRNDEIGIFRLGAVAKVHPDVQKFADLAGRPIKTLEDLKRCYTQQIVATTCLGINHPIFNQRVFDYCIVDEASQITLPVCLGPIRMARTFILVGDHYQLPPLVQNKEAQEGGLDISLFKMLSDKHPSSVVNLEHQYRMCEDIMTLSNTLIYDGRLKCGTQTVVNNSITIPNMAALKQHHRNPLTILGTDSRKVCTSPAPGTCWLRDLLEPSVKACFVNTDPLGSASREAQENSGSRITNLCEVALATQIVESLISTGVLSTDIGIITLYRSQIMLLKHSLRHRSGVEMHTADKFQGRDKEVVVLSLVRSNESRNVGELLKDWRRVNVAFTRARTKLLILGSKSTLRGNELLSQFVTLMEGKGWCYDLPAGATEGHVWEENGTQLSSVKGSAEAMLGGEGEVITDKGLGKGKGKGKENKFGKRAPAKQGKLDAKALIGRRPVLRDIVNDAS